MANPGHEQLALVPATQAAQDLLEQQPYVPQSPFEAYIVSKLEALPPIQRSMELLNSRFTELAARAALQQQQLTKLEQQQQHMDEQQLQLTFEQHRQRGHVNALAWQAATNMDAKHEAEVEGCLVVSLPRNIKQQPLTREQVAGELGVGVELLEQPPHRKGAVLAKLGVQAARGTLASLRSAAGQGPPATPGGQGDSPGGHAGQGISQTLPSGDTPPLAG